MRFHKTLSTVLFVIAAALPTVGFSAPPEEENRVVLGRVGQVLKNTKVFKRASLKSGSYFAVKEDQFLVVKADAPKDWIKVLLNTGRYGYIPANSIDVLAYEVTAESTRPVAMPASTLVASRGTTGARAAAAQAGLNYQGTPYVWGGNDIQNGIDCSGFVQKLYGAIGLNLPRTAAEQAMVGSPITRLENLQKGDRLYFWDSKRNKIGHTGLYLGGGQFVHSSSSRGGVAVDDIRNRKWMNILVAARR